MANFELFTRFQNIKKKIPMEIVGEEGIAPARVFRCAEIARITEAGYEGLSVPEIELEEKLRRVFIEKIK